MWSAKYTCLSILVLAFAFTHCSSPATTDRTFSNYDPAKRSLLNYTFIGAVDNAPVHALETFDRAVINDLDIKSITIFSKGGKNPEDTLEKRQYSYSDQAKQLHYTDYRFDETPNIWSDGKLDFNWKEGNGNIVFTKNFGVQRSHKTKIERIKNGYLFLREKLANRIDSTWIYGDLKLPDKVITKIGNSLYSVEIFLPEGSSTSQIESVFNNLGFTQQSLMLAEKTVVFTKNNRPTSAFLLNEFFSQIAQTKKWVYDKQQNLIQYDEYVGNTTTRSISWSYREDLLPDMMTIDRKQYFYSYE